jgi:pSer/pThr/pTyr-binding forkhead associated (FHA) protein
MIVIVRPPVDVASASSTMIALALLHPHQIKPVRRWIFDQVDLIRIGRSQENDVILYSAVISRHHLELHRRSGEWWAVNLGQNGTYVEDVAIGRLRLSGETTLGLAKSGPRLQISLCDQRVPASPVSATLSLGRAYPKVREAEDTTVVDLPIDVWS